MLRRRRQWPAKRADSSRQQDESTASGFPVEVLLAEFNALRAEHDMRVGKQQDISQFALALVGALVALLGVLVTHDGEIGDVRAVYLVASVLLSGLTLMTLDHEMNIAHIQIYIHDQAIAAIRQALVSRTTEEIPFWSWVSFRAAHQQHPGWRTVPVTTGLASAKYWTTFLPNMLLLVAYPATASGHDNPWYGWAGYGVAVAVFLFALVASSFTSRLYLRMGERRS
jgi:hypothetical protein